MKKQPNETAALFSLILIMPFVWVFFMAIGFAILILCFGGVDDLLMVARDLAWVPEYGESSFFKALVGFVIAGSGGVTLYLWRRIFY